MTRIGEKRRGRIGPLAVCLCLPALLLCGCARAEAVSRTGFFFGTVVDVTVYAAGETAEAALDAVMARFNEIEQEMSVNIAGSDVDRLNGGAGASVAVSADTINVLMRALDFAQLSGGAFDPTVEPLVALWGIGTQNARVPGADEIEAARARIDYRRVTADAAAGTVSLGNGQSVDLGGIAKGYAADEARRLLEDAGVERALLNLGGNVLTLGAKPGGTPWKIGLQDPLGEQGSYIGILEMTGGTAVTSGVYERYFMEDGRRYHHILDPSTGYPADNGLLSVTIVTDISMDADALSTAAFVLGLADGLALVRSLDGAEAVFVTTEKRIIITSGIYESFTVTDASYTIEEG